MFRIRPIHPEDESQLANLYEATVRRWAPEFYATEQVEAWATAARDADRFQSMLYTGQTFVAINPSNQPIGFSGVESTGRIASLYVAPDSTRKGIGTALLDRVVEFASEKKITPLWSEASFLSRPLFERSGFFVAYSERVEINCVEFERWIVRQKAITTG